MYIISRVESRAIASLPDHVQDPRQMLVCNPYNGRIPLWDSSVCVCVCLHLHPK